MYVYESEGDDWSIVGLELSQLCLRIVVECNILSLLSEYIGVEDVVCDSAIIVDITPIVGAFPSFSLESISF